MDRDENADGRGGGSLDGGGGVQRRARCAKYTPSKFSTAKLARRRETRYGMLFGVFLIRLNPASSALRG